MSGSTLMIFGRIWPVSTCLNSGWGPPMYQGARCSSPGWLAPIIAGIASGAFYFSQLVTQRSLIFF